MAIKLCDNGHTFKKTSACPVCPTCSTKEMKGKYSKEFPSIGAPALRALDSIKIQSLSDLTKFSEEELLALHGFGPRALRLLHEALKEKGLSFAQK